MAHAYTPGLRVAENELLRKHRTLPLKGEVVVKNGVAVKPEDVVARTFLPGKVDIVNVANKMGIHQSEVPSSMVKREYDEVLHGEVIAESKSLFGLLKSKVMAPLSGTIESVSGVTGQVILRGPPQPVAINAYLEGTIVEVIPQEGVVVETSGTLIQGIFGIGGEVTGELTVVTPSPGDVLDECLLSENHKGKVIIGGCLVTRDALKKAIELEVSGIVVGGLDDQDLRGLLGHDLGVAITGHENLGITLIVTEGFGKIEMAARTFSLLHRHQGRQASINGATQIRAGVIRPELIIPIPGVQPRQDVPAEQQGMNIGSIVRVIRNPYFGKLGTIMRLMAEPTRLDSGSKARVVSIQLENFEEPVMVPRANIEIIEGYE